MPELAAKPIGKARAPKKPPWVTELKGVPFDDVTVWGWPDLSLAPVVDTPNFADTFNVKVKVRPAAFHAVEQFREVTVWCKDLSTGECDKQTFTVDTWKAGEYPRTFHLSLIDDAVYDPDFDNEVEITVDPLKTFPDKDRSNNTLRMWGTTIG